MTQNNVIPFPTRRIEPNSEAFKQNPALSASEQPQSLVFEIQKYLPKGKQIRLIEESKGTHQIPHKIFEFMIKSTESRVEASVFACLIRYTLGFHRSTCETSHTFIAEWTGYSVTSVRRGLDALLLAQLIRCLETGHSHKESTVYEVGVVKGYLESLTLKSPTIPLALSSQTIEKNNPFLGNSDSKSNQLCPQGAQYYATIRPSTVPCAGTKKDNTNKETNKTLSPSKNQSAFLQSYFSTLIPENKKQRELKFYQSLEKDYCIQDISDAVQLLVERGIPSTSAPCHSPMAYLSLSIASVLPLVIARREKQKIRSELAIQEEKKRREEAEREAEETNRFDEKLSLFYQAFPTEELREQYFRKFALDNPMFSCGSFMLKNIAISAWAESKKNN